MSTALEERLYHTTAGKQWKKIGVRHHHGICLPLFSLHSETSGGIGEFLDLLPLIDWCKQVGFDVIQLLPLNDNGRDVSPYNAISANALNPLHLSLSALPFVEKVPEYEEKLFHLRQWNRSYRVNYAHVWEYKRVFLKEYFTLVFEEVSKTPPYEQFVKQNPWVFPYALFKTFKELHEWKSWEMWPQEHHDPSQEEYENLLKEHKASVEFHTFVQFFCFQQFEKVKEEAEKAHVLLKGDIPILISRDSADVWAYRPFFYTNLAAGAPPDMYSKEGQYWGFPLYNWEELEKNNYCWWKERLQVASRLYHLYRIDHVVGFFRIWAIPIGKLATEGYFFPEDESTWISHGKKIMEMMLNSSPLLPIGEDLGVVPPSVRTCLAELGICGTKMMRWERRWEEDGGFIPPSDYRPESMTTVSTHDSDTLQLWWKHFPKEARLFSSFKGWDYKPFLSKERQYEILWDSHHSNSLFHINLLQEYLALFPELVHDNPHDERINIPGRVLDTNWTYKFKPSVEELVKHPPLRDTLSQLVQTKTRNF